MKVRRATIYRGESQAHLIIERQLKQRGWNVETVISATDEPIVSSDGLFVSGLRAICDAYSVYPRD